MSEIIGTQPMETDMTSDRNDGSMIIQRKRKLGIEDLPSYPDLPAKRVRHDAPIGRSRKLGIEDLPSYPHLPVKRVRRARLI